jgi:hypothetical protein
MSSFNKYAGNKDCPKCHGKGNYMYDDVHTKPCEVCCKHKGGFWQLDKEFHGSTNLCCLDGCGFTKPVDKTIKSKVRLTLVEKARRYILTKLAPIIRQLSKE